MKFTASILLLVAVASGVAQAAPVTTTVAAPNLTPQLKFKGGVRVTESNPPTEDNDLLSQVNAQAQDCAPNSFRKADTLSNDIASDLFHPNVEWVPVPTAQWNFESNDKTVPYPLGFRRAAFDHSSGSVMCLKMPPTTAQHKLEVSIETTSKGTICITDTRRGRLNTAATELLRTCDDDGQVTACFNALNGAASPNDVASQFAVAIGCTGSGCHEQSNALIYYRVRQSKLKWTDTQDAVNNLDMWCMAMAAVSADVNYASTIAKADAKTGGIATLHENPANMVPQMYPTDLWSAKRVLPVELNPGHKNVPDPNEETRPTPEIRHPGGDHMNGATNVAVSVAAVLLPIVALLF